MSEPHRPELGDLSPQRAGKLSTKAPITINIIQISAVHWKKCL
ncbi:hypothetical protein GRAN_4830 [Granulicella sibirica]|uniref:Uncharacterized protein n=1 Tax=Granulicella sibirica TaxID=2479048 RepID=A0A4Q0SXP2_9BACT|nr:hypothetical protein GRAN_4830 [Granulicella sibirica]